MPRPRNKQNLLKAGEEYKLKLIEMADSMSEKEMNTEFNFSGDTSKKERHWGRDKNLRDIWIHLYEWHRMLLEFVNTNLNKGGNAPITCGEGRVDVVARLCMVVDWCIDHPEYTAKIKVIPKKDYPVLMPCEF